MNTSDAVFEIIIARLLIEKPYASQTMNPPASIDMYSSDTSLLDFVRRIRRIWRYGDSAISTPAIVAHRASTSAACQLFIESSLAGRFAGRSLPGALAGLVLREGLGRVDVAQRRVVGHDRVPARRLDPVSLAQQRDDRAGLHLADAGQGHEALVQVLRIRRARPHRRGVVVVVVGDRRAQVAGPLRHVARK